MPRKRKRRVYKTTKRFGSKRKTTTKKGKRDYMREYMRDYRKNKKGKKK